MLKIPGIGLNRSLPIHNAQRRGRVCRSCIFAQQQDPKDESRSTYAQTPPLVRTLVSGLTSLITAATDGDVPDDDSLTEENRTGLAISPEELLEGVRKDFTEAGYLWSGEISEELYALDCEFTDPTLSFKGLPTFKRNISSLKPWLERLLRSSRVVLYSCELCEDLRRVRATWRMVGDLRLPWSPRIDLSGQTDFVYDPRRGNRIVRYIEVWDVSAATALLQLLAPGQQSGKS